MNSDTPSTIIIMVSPAFCLLCLFCFVFFFLPLETIGAKLLVMGLGDSYFPDD